MHTDARARDISRKPSSGNLILAFFVMSFIPMVLVSVLIMNEFDKSYHEKVHDHLRELVQKHQQNIDYFLRERLGNIKFLTEIPGFGELIRQDSLAGTLDRLNACHGNVFEDLGVIDEHGRHVAYAGPYDLMDKSYQDAFWFKKVIKNEYYVSDVFLGFRNHPHFIMAVKRNWQGKPLILRSTIDFEAFNTVVETVHIGETGFAFILNRTGELQTRPWLDVSPNTPMYIDFFKKTLKNAGEEVQIFERKDVHGQETIYAATFLRDGEWLLVYQQATADAFEILNRTEKKAVIVLLAVGFCTFIISIVLHLTSFKTILRNIR